MASTYESEKNGKKVLNVVFSKRAQKTQTRKTQSRTAPKAKYTQTSSNSGTKQSIRDSVMAKAPQLRTDHLPQKDYVQKSGERYNVLQHGASALRSVREARNSQLTADRSRQMRNMYMVNQNNRTNVDINTARMQNNLAVQKLTNQGAMNRTRQQGSTQKEVTNMQIGANVSLAEQNNIAQSRMARQKEMADLSKTTEGIKSIIARVYSHGDIEEMTSEQQYRAYSEVMRQYTDDGSYPKATMTYDEGYGMIPFDADWSDVAKPSTASKIVKSLDQNKTTTNLTREYEEEFKQAR